MEGDDDGVRFSMTALQNKPRRLGNPAIAPPARALPRKVGVVGAGSIGPDIGYYLTSELPDCSLVLVDVDSRALAQARERLAKYAAKGVERGKLSADHAARVMAGLTVTAEYALLSDCDWVIEAASENLPLKQRIFAEIEAVVGTGALLTSNTSSLPAHRLFEHLQHPNRATVTHFFAPAFQNPVVEVVEWDGADVQSIDIFDGYSRAPARCRSSLPTTFASCSIGFSTTGATRAAICWRKRRRRRSTALPRNSRTPDPSLS